MEPTDRITFVLPAEERHALEALAANEDRNMSQLCRLALRQILAERAEPPTVTIAGSE